MKVKIKLDDDQVDEVIAEALWNNYDSIKDDKNYGTPEEHLALVHAFKIIYNYFTGENL